MVKRILGVSLAALMTLTSTVSAFALTPDSGLLDATGNYANSTSSVIADKDATDINGVVGKDNTQGEYSQYDVVVDGYTGTTIDPFESETEVYATVMPSYSIKIPKTIILSASGLGLYDIGVKGDMSGAQTLTIKPEDKIADTTEVDFYMSEQGAFVGAKDDVVATVEQDKTEWRYSDINKADFTWLENAGKITATLTAGSWAGTFNFIIDMDCIGSISVGELEEKYNVQYYSALHLAVTDINNDAIGVNADVPKEEAVAAAYIDEEGNANAVLLKDFAETTRVAPSVDMTINLGGNTLDISSSNVVIDVMSGNITIDGRLSGSSVKNNRESGNANVIQVRSGNLTVLGGTYSVRTVDSYSCRVLMNAADVTIKDATIVAKAESSDAYGINSQSGNVNLINCDINVNSLSKYAYGAYNVGNLNVSSCNIEVDSPTYSYGIRNKGTLNASDSKITATSAYLGTTEGYTNLSLGISSINGSARISNCNVKGTHSAINTRNAELYVDGGVYEGYGHGGFYLTGDGSKVSYIKNATLIDCDWYGPYEVSDTEEMDNDAGIYVGGSDSNDGSGEITSHNFKLYMDNCNIIADRQAIVLRGTAGESGHKMYVSNTTISDGSYIRIDSMTHNLYIGQGCNFTADNCYHHRLTPEELAQLVFYTNEIYSF